MKSLRLAFLLLLVFLISCSNKGEKVIQREKISDSAELVLLRGTLGNRTYTRQEIRYSLDGREYSNYFVPDLRNALEWIRDNTSQDATILSWWDYGHMIRGFSGRKTIIFSPSEEILYTLANSKWDTSAQGEFSTQSSIKDVIVALITDEPDVAASVMRAYDAQYVLVARKDHAIVFTLLVILDINPEEFFDNYEPKENAKEFMIYRMINEEKIENFRLAYSDDSCVIYRLI